LPATAPDESTPILACQGNFTLGFRAFPHYVRAIREKGLEGKEGYCILNHMGRRGPERIRSDGNLEP